MNNLEIQICQLPFRIGNLVEKFLEKSIFYSVPVPISAVSLKRLSTYILLDFKVTKWAVSSLTHSPNPFQVNMFM